MRVLDSKDRLSYPIQINANELGGNSDDVRRNRSYNRQKTTLQNTRTPGIRKSKTTAFSGLFGKKTIDKESPPSLLDSHQPSLDNIQTWIKYQSYLEYHDETIETFESIKDVFRFRPQFNKEVMKKKDKLQAKISIEELRKYPTKTIDIKVKE